MASSTGRTDPTSSYRIRLAQPEDTLLLPEVERVAGQRFLESEEHLGDGEIGKPEWFMTAQRRDLLWVAVTEDDVPVGFALFEPFPDSLHLEEVDVLPDHAGHGLGRRLIEAGAEEGRARGFTRVTLSTFRSVPWNGPYYERLGFSELPPEDWSEAVRSRVANEARHGLDPARRMVMVRPLDEEGIDGAGS